MGPTEMEPNPYSLRVPVECDTVGPLATARCVIQPGTLRGRRNRRFDVSSVLSGLSDSLISGPEALPVASDRTSQRPVI